MAPGISVDHVRADDGKTNRAGALGEPVEAGARFELADADGVVSEEQHPFEEEAFDQVALRGVDKAYGDKVTAVKFTQATALVVRWTSTVIPP